jgi:hypothetical protein
MTDLQHHVSKWLHPSNESFFVVSTDANGDEVEWLHDPYEAVPEYVETPIVHNEFPPPRRSMPRVVPPEHEKPGVKDHSRIKRMLREWL